MLQECRNCGAQIEYSAESQSLVCPYCETVNAIRKHEDALPVDPEFIIPLALTPDALEKNVYGYLAQGDYTPDDMLETVVFLRRECFYVPTYTFNVDYDVNWTASFGYDQEEPYTAHREGKAYTAYRTVTDWRPVSGRDSGTFEVSTYAGVDLTAVSLNPVEIVPLTVLQGERTRFDPAFMQGLRAEAFAVPEQLAYSSLTDEVGRKITHNVQRHAQGNRQKDWNWNMSSLTPSVSTLYVPVSSAVFDYKGQNYHYWSDGIGGESVKADPLPVDEQRRKDVKRGYVPIFVSFAGLLAAAFYTKAVSVLPESLLQNLLVGMIGPFFALCYALIRRSSLLGYSNKLRQSILAQMQASASSASDLDDKERQALVSSMQRPVRSLLARTELDKKIIPAVSVLAFLGGFLPSLYGSSTPDTGTAAVPKTPATGVSQTSRERSVTPPSQVEENRCLTKALLADLSKSENAFIRQNLISRGYEIANSDVQFNARETADSRKGREFSCAGKITVTSKSTNAPILSYNIAYSAFADEGSSGVDLKTVSRTSFLPSEAEMAAQQELARQATEKHRAETTAGQQAETQKARDDQAGQEEEKRRAEAAARQQAEAQRARENQARREAEMKRQQELARQEEEKRRAEAAAKQQAEAQKKEKEKGVASKLWRSIKDSTRKK